MKENLVSLAKLLATDNVFNLDFFSSTVEEKYELSKKRFPDLSQEDFSEFLQKLQEVQKRELSPEELEQISGGGLFSVIGGLLLGALQLVGFGGNSTQPTTYEQPQSAIVHQLTFDRLQSDEEDDSSLANEIYHAATEENDGPLANEIYHATTEENDGSLVGNSGKTAAEENTVSSAKSNTEENSTEELHNQQTLPTSKSDIKAIDESSTENENGNDSNRSSVSSKTSDDDESWQEVGKKQNKNSKNKNKNKNNQTNKQTKIRKQTNKLTNKSTQPENSPYAFIQGGKSSTEIDSSSASSETLKKNVENERSESNGNSQMVEKKQTRKNTQTENIPSAFTQDGKSSTEIDNSSASSETLKKNVENERSESSESSQSIEKNEIKHHNRTAVLTQRAIHHIFYGDFNDKGFLCGGGHTKFAKENMKNACQKLRDISSKIDNGKFQKVIKNLPDFENDITTDSSGVGFLRTKGLAANRHNSVKTFFPDDFERSNLEEVIQSALDDSAWAGKKDLQDANDKDIIVQEVLYSYNNKKIKARVVFTVHKDASNCYLRVNTCFPIYEGVSS